MNKEERNVVQVALDHLLEVQQELFEEHAQKNRVSLTVNDWDEMATISRKIAVIKGLQYDVAQQERANSYASGMRQYSADGGEY